jgi:metallophosphoesterase (TIGR00282 family)
LELLADERIPLIRPANFLPHIPGRGFLIKEVKGKQLLTINAIGTVHMKKTYQMPFPIVDEIIAKNPNIKHIFIDWHAEATSEKRAMGWYLDGRVSAVIGSHTHTPTADEQILPNGTAFISDVGMVGPHRSIIGEDIKLNLHRMTTQLSTKTDVAEAPPYEINAVIIDIHDETGHAISIKRIRKVVDKSLA